MQNQLRNYLRSLVQLAGTKKLKQCQSIPASFFMNVKTAKPPYDRSKATVVFFVLTEL